MGVVYLAHDPRRGEKVALKTLIGVDPTALYRFKHEFRAFADLAHRNLVALHDLVSDGERWFFTMELIEGAQFLDHVRARPESLRPALRQLAEGVAALHAGGKLHRDVKPTNVLVAADGRVAILDFGLGADVASTGLHQSTSRHVLGTVAYMSPEQALGRPVSAASDWYSVGVMLFEALTGRLPFEGNGIEVLLEKQQRDPPAPSALAAGVPQDLCDLCMELLRRDPGARPDGTAVVRRLSGPDSAAPTASAAAPTAAVALVGRARHLELLDDAFNLARSRRTVTVHVHGRSGMGKTSLVHQFLDGLVSREETVILAGRCYERESVPYKAFDSAIDALSRHLARLPRLEVEALLPRDIVPLARIFPVLRRVEAIAAAPATAEIVDVQELRRRAFAALRELLARIGDRHPLVLHVDDVQWGDADSAALLADVLRPPDPPPLMLVLSYRSEDASTSPFLRAVLDARFGDRREIAVEALTERESRDFARSLLARGDGSEHPEAAAIARESRGNPFFVQELVRHVQAGEAVGERGPSSAEITLDGVLAERIRRLPDAARRLLEVVAVAGRPVAAAHAQRAAEIAGSERAALGSLRAERLVRTTGGVGDEDLDTYHDRIRETVLATLSPQETGSHHLRLAAVLDSSGDSDPEILAVHYREAGAVERARTCLARAAEQASATLAFDHAARLWQLAIDVGPADTAQRRSMLRSLGDALANGRRGAEAAEAYFEASAGTTGAETVDLQCRAAQQLLVSGRIDEALKVLVPLLASLGMSLHKTRLGAIAGILVRSAWLRVRGTSCRFRDEREIAPRDLWRTDVGWFTAQTLSIIDPLQAAALHTRQVLLALRNGERSRAARAVAMECWYSTFGGFRTRARTRRLERQANEFAAGVSDPRLTVPVKLMTGGIAPYMEGRWKEALERFDDVAEIIRTQCPGLAWEMHFARLYAVRCLYFLGEMTEFACRTAELVKDADARGDLYAATDLRAIAVPATWLVRGEPREAVAEVERALARWSRKDFDFKHYYAMLSRVDAALYRADVAAARTVCAEYERPYARSGMKRAEIIRLHVLLMWTRVALAVAADDKRRGLGDGRADVRAALRILRREPSPWASAWTTLLAAGASAIAGVDDETHRLLVAAESELERVDMRIHAVVARRRRGELVGGDEGRALVASADAAMTAQGIREPARWADMYAPGFRSGS